MDYEKWLSYGERLGLKDEQLQNLVAAKEQEYIAREDRARDRSDARDEAARREAEVARQFEMEKLKMQADLEMTKLKMEQDRNELARTYTEDSRSKSLKPRLPKFDEQKDDIDAFLQRFEKFATSQGWPEDNWAVSLSPLLTGKGLQVYSSMPSTLIDNYRELKKALLRRYELTEEGFRLKFRDSKPEKGETAFQFIARLNRYLGRWTEMAEIDQSYGGLQDLLIREQFIQTCSAEMAVFLRERVPKNVEELTRLAEQYMEAHGGSIIKHSKTSHDNNFNRVKPQHNKTHYQENQKQTGDNTKTSGKTTRRCFVCNGEGHMARDHLPDGKIAGMVTYKDTESNWRKRDNKPTDVKKKSNQNDGNGKRAALCKTVDKKIVRSGKTVEDVIGKDVIEDSEAKDVVIETEGKIAKKTLGRIQLVDDSGMPVQKGYLGEHEVQVLRDTGCSSAAVKEDLVRPDQLTSKELPCVLIDGTVRRFKIAKVTVDTPYYTGELEAMCMKNPIYDLVIGNVDGVRLTADRNWEPVRYQTQVSAVMTRAQTKKENQSIKPLVVQVDKVDAVGLDGLIEAQKDDSSLDNWWKLAKKKVSCDEQSTKKYRMEVQGEVLYRVYTQTRGNLSEEVRQIAVPKLYRTQVMALAHESIVGGHLGVQKTIDRISSSFHWPGITGDVTRYCQSCDICQKTIPKGRITKVPLGEMHLIEEPFQRVAVDLIGPIYPVSEDKNRYILTVVDYATRYPEAVALPRIETERIAEALLGIFCRVGFPKEILSDRGTQFTSELLEEVCRLVSVKQLFTTPYNPKCNGWCERMNGVLKSMLKKMCQEKPKDWDRYIPAVLFAYREVPQASTGFVPFELLYGRTVRGPMQALKGIWTKELDETSEVKTTYQYVLDLRNKLEETCKIARDSLNDAQGTYKRHYDKKAKNRQLEVGQKVLILLPTDHNKLLLQWKGPYDVVEVINKMDYRVNVSGKEKVYHINLLKRYVEREHDVEELAVQRDMQSKQQVGPYQRILANSC